MIVFFANFIGLCLVLLAMFIAFGVGTDVGKREIKSVPEADRLFTGKMAIVSAVSVFIGIIMLLVRA